jgi:hypothetical protein
MGTLLTGAGSPVNRFSYLLEMHSRKACPLATIWETTGGEDKE